MGDKIRENQKTFDVKLPMKKTVSPEQAEINRKRQVETKIRYYFAELTGKDAHPISRDVLYEVGFKALDKKEQGKFSSDGKIQAETWNKMMKDIGIDGHNIKESMSVEEFNAFIKRLLGK